MGFVILTPSSLIHHCTSSYNGKKAATIYVAAFSNSSISIPKNGKIKSISQLDLIRFAQWDGLKLFGSSISQYQAKMGKRSHHKFKNKAVYASLFGVGAPEALVIGVVALLVFGPKGLAEVARNLGKTLREFQPTLRELQEVSREFKSTLEREIGLDDVDNKPALKSSTSNSTKPAPEGSETNTGPNGTPPESAEDSVDDEIKIRADQLRQTLLRLQKEQEEERATEEKEKAEEQTQAQVPETPVQDTPEASQDSDNPKEASSSTEKTLSQSSESNAVDEATPSITT